MLYKFIKAAKKNVYIRPEDWKKYIHLTANGKESIIDLEEIPARQRKYTFDVADLKEELMADIFRHGMNKFLQSLRPFQKAVVAGTLEKHMKKRKLKLNGKIKVFYAHDEEAIYYENIPLEFQKEMHAKTKTITLEELKKKHGNDQYLELLLLYTNYRNGINYHKVPHGGIEATLKSVKEQNKELLNPLELVRAVKKGGSLTTENLNEEVTTVNNESLNSYQLIALYDVLARLNAMGALKNGYVILKGRQSKRKEALKKELKKREIAVINSELLKELTGEENENGLRRIKNALETVPDLKLKVTGTIGDEPVLIEWKVAYLNGVISTSEMSVTKYSIDPAFFDLERYSTMDTKAFTRIQENAETREVINISKVYLHLIKCAGMKSSGERKTFISIDNFNDLLQREYTADKKRNLKALTKTLLFLKKHGLIENYWRLQNGAFRVDIGG